MKHARRFWISLTTLATALVLICGPGATWLQSRHEWADPVQKWDAAYLVCGARAQNRRVTALSRWLRTRQEGNAPADIQVLVGNDPYKGLWCRRHQSNHTRTEWALEKLADSFSTTAPSMSQAPPVVVPGEFLNTDGEMIALAKHLESHPEIQSIALCTSRFHSRRLLQRYRKHNGDHPSVGIIPGVRYWENRAPWIVLGEYLKLLRDRMGLTNHLTRSEKSML